MKKSRKILIIGLLFAFLVSMVGCSKDEKSGEKSAEKVYEWKMASIYTDPAVNDKFNSLGNAMKKFIDLVEERSKGRISISPFYNSVLGANPAMFEQVRNGELEVYYGQPMASADKRFGAWNIPYLFTTYDEIEKANAVPNGPLFKLSEQWMKDSKLQLLAVGAANLRGFANAKHPVKTPKDLKDLKVRTYEDPIVNIFWSNTSIASPLAFGEVYSALQTKTVDGLEFPPTSMVLRKFYEVVKHYTDIDWQWASGANIVVGEKYWNELPDDLKKIVQQAAVEAVQLQGKLEKETTEQAITELKAQGVEVIRLTPEEREEWVKYARSQDDKLRQAIGEQVFNDVLKAAESVKTK